MLDTEELNAVDDFRFANRMPSRAAAVRELLRRGMASAGFPIGRTGEKSGAYGVISAPQDGREASVQAPSK
jgi:hypothetical protein